jgi:hypothetical protein
LAERNFFSKSVPVFLSTPTAFQFKDLRQATSKDAPDPKSRVLPGFLKLFLTNLSKKVFILIYYLVHLKRTSSHRSGANIVSGAPSVSAAPPEAAADSFGAEAVNDTGAGNSELLEVETPTDLPFARGGTEPETPPNLPFARGGNSQDKKSFVRELFTKAGNMIQFRKRKKLDKIMTLFLKYPKITNDEVEKLLHVSDATAARLLAQLVKENKIRKVGKTGHYVAYEKI